MSEIGQTRVASWVERLDMAVWVIDQDGSVCFINEEAQRMLGLSAAECLGLPCHRVIGGTDASGHPFCCRNCHVVCKAKRHAPIEPTKLRIVGPDGGDRWIQIVSITVSAPERPGFELVHCAIDVDRSSRAEEYIDRIASRSQTGSRETPRANLADLTVRETEILAMLAEDENSYSIAATLHVSHATVRNHIQHIVTKLHAHSIMEAVAHYLLGGPGTPNR